MAFLLNISKENSDVKKFDDMISEMRLKSFLNTAILHDHIQEILKEMTDSVGDNGKNFGRNKIEMLSFITYFKRDENLSKYIISYAAEYNPDKFNISIETIKEIQEQEKEMVSKELKNIMEFESSDSVSAEEVNAQKEPNLNINTKAFDVYKLYLDRVVSLPFIKTNQDTLKSDQKQPNIFFKNCKYINYEVLQNDYFENARRCYVTYDFHPFDRFIFFYFYKICVTYMENRIKKLVSYVKSEPFLQFKNFNAFLKKFSPHFNAENVTSCGPSFIPISVNYVGGRSQSDEKIFLFDIDDVLFPTKQIISDFKHNYPFIGKQIHLPLRDFMMKILKTDWKNLKRKAKKLLNE
ncbi:hypothetical protein CWI37_1672p0020, partial [Hamiltosporidium tvaerminnensis]